MTFMAWIKHLIGLDVKERVAALELRKQHNERSTMDAIDVFKQFAKDRKR